MLQPMAGVAKEIVRALMHLPLVRRRNQQRGARAQNTRYFPQRFGRLAKVLQRDNIEDGIEGVWRKWQGGQICDAIEFTVIPLRIANRKIDGDVVLPFELNRMTRFTCTGVKNARPVLKIQGKLTHGSLDQAFKVENLVPEDARKTVCQGGVAQSSAASVESSRSPIRWFKINCVTFAAESF